MRQPLWKKFLSQFVDVLIERTEGQFNGELLVILSKGRYQLCTQNAIYSFADKYDNFNLSFQGLEWEKYNVQDVLILGLGLASIPYMLETRFNKKFKYTAVEIDEEVVFLANKYVLHELQSPIEVHVADAGNFVEIHKGTYDLLTMDVFVDDKIPNKFRTEIFFDKLRKS